jgi:hypothetical protein
MLHNWEEAEQYYHSYCSTFVLEQYLKQHQQRILKKDIKCENISSVNNLIIF